MSRYFGNVPQEILVAHALEHAALRRAGMAGLGHVAGCSCSSCGNGIGDIVDARRNYRVRLSGLDELSTASKVAIGIGAIAAAGLVAYWITRR